MIQVISKDQRYFSDFQWLQAFWLFSFSDYYDPRNIQFGPLRVFNDDIVQPGRAFPLHPHKEMEIITIVLEGEITHQDTDGYKAVIHAGDVQRMSAGRGVTHTEMNLSAKPVHLYQIWIYPETPGLAPTYAKKSFSRRLWRNHLCPIASGQGFSEAMPFHADATIYRSELDQGKTVKFPVSDTRRILVYVSTGEVQANHVKLGAGDQARIDLEEKLDIQALTDASFVLIDIPSAKGWGYDEQTLRGKKV